MVDYAKSATKAKGTLAKFGQSITRTANTAGAYANGAVPITSVASARLGAVFGVGLVGAKGSQYIRGSLVESGDKQILLDVDGPVEMTDTYTIGGVVYRVISIDEINPAGIPVLYDLHVRRA